MDNNNFLIGTWRLISFEQICEDGQVNYPLGENPVGYILYNGDGYVSVNMMASGREKYDSGDIMLGSLEEKLNAVETYTSYSGKYEFHGDKVIHKIEVSLFPNWIGDDLERFIEIKEDKLFMKTAPILYDGKRQTAYMIWDKIEKV